MCESQPWCHTTGALQATLRHFLGMEVQLLCPANVREPAMVSYQGGSASNIEVFLGNGSQSLMLGTALVPSWLGHANVREPAMVQYQGGL